MNQVVSFTLAFTITVVAAVVLFRLDSSNSFASEMPVSPSPDQTSHLVTLYAHDPLSNTYGFEDATYGQIIQDHEVKNRSSDLNFHVRQENAFTVGIEGGRVGSIVNLGSDAGMIEQYGIQETVGGGQGFASIRLNDGQVIIGRSYPAHFVSLPDPSKSASAEVFLGHTYLIAMADSGGPVDLIVKAKVVAYRAGESVTLRWARL